MPKKKPVKKTAPRTKKQAVTTVVLPGFYEHAKTTLSQVRTHIIPINRLIGVWWVAGLILFGSSQLEQYRLLRESVGMVSDSLSGAGRTVLELVITIATVVTGGLNAAFSESQQLFSVLVYVLLWLALVWLLRNLLAGGKVNVRDALYNSAAPLISTLIIVFIGALQLLPAALGVLALSTALSSGALMANIFVAIGLIAVVIALTILSLYWVMTTVFASMIVTLPGTYPVAALRSARELVKGYRLRLLLRVAGLIVTVLLVSLLVMIPLVSLDFFLNVSWLPLSVIALHGVMLAAFVYGVSYLYLLYRKLIDERS